MKNAQGIFKAAQLEQSEEGDEWQECRSERQGICRRGAGLGFDSEHTGSTEGGAGERSDRMALAAVLRSDAGGWGRSRRSIWQAQVTVHRPRFVTAPP